MKKLSITMKITVWYVLFLMVVTAGFLAVMTYNGNLRASGMAKSKLTEAVADASEEINATGENFTIEKDLNFYEDGIYISVYDGEGELVEGRRPGEIARYPVLCDKEIEKITDYKGNVWYVYDSFFYINDKPFWVRGIVKDFAEDSTFSFMIKASALAFPILLILAAIGGYMITRKAFRPVRDILETADEISRDGDLSRRIKIDEEKGGNAKDEIYRLGYTFNNMFDKLEKSFEQEKQFTSDVSHELRTPLAVIISQSEYAKEDEEYRLKALEIINNEAQRMSGLVNRLLTITRSDSGRLKPEMDNVDLSSMCMAVAEQQEAVAEDKEITIHQDIEKNVYVYADESMLIRVLLNLMENGIKYGKEKGNLYVRLRGTEKDGAVISIEDDGIGIEKKDLEKIWERFYRVDSSRTKEGSGLGLSMVKGLVKVHGGTINVKSTPGKGSIFEVVLPGKAARKGDAENE